VLQWKIVKANRRHYFHYLWLNFGINACFMSAEESCEFERSLKLSTIYSLEDDCVLLLGCDINHCTLPWDLYRNLSHSKSLQIPIFPLCNSFIPLYVVLSKQAVVTDLFKKVCFLWTLNVYSICNHLHSVIFLKLSWENILKPVLRPPDLSILV
jgi:hypothetical protein